jgi:hypothetical protein
MESDALTAMADDDDDLLGTAAHKTRMVASGESQKELVHVVGLEFGHRSVPAILNSAQIVARADVRSLSAAPSDPTVV